MPLGGAGACFTGKFLKIYVLLWPLQSFLNNFQANFIVLASKFECFTNQDAFCSHIVMKRFKIVEKFYSFKVLLKMAGGGASPFRVASAPKLHCLILGKNASQ